MKRRIVVSIVGVALVALLLLGVPLAMAVEQFYAKEQVLYLDREASEANRAVNTAALRRDRGIDIQDDNGTHLAIYDQRGYKLGGAGPARADRPVRSALRGEAADARLDGDTVVAVPLYDAGQTVGALRASEARSVVVTRTIRAWLVMAVLAVAALAVVALLARRQARRLTRPVDELVRSADRLGGGDFSVRTAPSGVEELDQLGRALDTTAGRLGGLVARERAFSTDASHQLRTPIAGLRVSVESALMRPDADLRQALEDTLEPIDRLDATVTDLLRLARDTHADRHPVDVGQLVREVEDDWRAPLTTRHRPFHVAVDADLAQPAVAEPAIRQILEVLIENADVHGAGTITVRARSVPGAVAIDVADEGLGATDPQAIFRRRTNGAHGIGLALARTLAEAEGARLVLERPGSRPVFTLMLPVEDL